MSKKFIAILLSVILLVSCFGLSVFAATGVDDGTGVTVSVDGVRYLGKVETDNNGNFVVFKSTSDGTEVKVGKGFDANGDGKTDICDLVYASANNTEQFSVASVFEAKNELSIRKNLIGFN